MQSEGILAGQPGFLYKSLQDKRKEREETD
jgi:hypothetical protein